MGADARIAQSAPKFKSRFHETIREAGRRTERVEYPLTELERRPYLDCRLPPFSRGERRRRGPRATGDGKRERERRPCKLHDFHFFFVLFLHLSPRALRPLPHRYHTATTVGRPTRGSRRAGPTSVGGPSFFTIPIEGNGHKAE